MRKLFLAAALMLIGSTAFAGIVPMQSMAVARRQHATAGGPAISDDFSSDTSANYTAINNAAHAVVVSSGVAISNQTWSDSWFYHTTALNTSNHYAQGVLSQGSTTNKGASQFVVRCSGNTTASTGYVVGVDRASGGIKVWSFSGGTKTFVGTFDFSGSFGANETHLVKVTVNSSNEFTAYVDWNDDLDFGDADEIATAITDSTYTSGAYVGVGFANNGELATVDNFEADDI